MEKLTQNLLTLIRIGIGTLEASDGACDALLQQTMLEWKALMNLAVNQRVAAVAIDGLQVLYNARLYKMEAVKASKQAWTMWVLECAGMLTQYEQRNALQKKVIADVAELLAENDVRMIVFKGQANASLYPNAAHRAPGDIDCYLTGLENQTRHEGVYNKGNKVLGDVGAMVDEHWYRHSKISFKGETIENHRVMGHTRGSKRRKQMENELEQMVVGEGLQVIEGCGRAVMPPAQFNACFLTYHALHHFLTEGLRMKQIVDWGVFLRTFHKAVDWKAFNAFCRRYQLDRFASAANYMAIHYLGVEVESEACLQDSQFAERILHDTLYGDEYLFNSGKSDWEVRWLIVKNMFTRDRWKYEDVAQENVWKHMWGSVKGFVLGGEE